MANSAKLSIAARKNFYNTGISIYIPASLWLSGNFLLQYPRNPIGDSYSTNISTGSTGQSGPNMRQKNSRRHNDIYPARSSGSNGIKPNANILPGFQGLTARFYSPTRSRTLLP